MPTPPPHRPRPRGPRRPRPINPQRPFRAMDAAASGISKRRLHSAEFRRIVRNVYIAGNAPADPLNDALAVLLVAGDGAFVSHHTAARLYRVVVPDDALLHASLPPGRHRSRLPGVMVHQSTRTPVTFRGVPATAAVDTFQDLVPLLGLVDLVILGDGMVRKRLTTTRALVAAASAMPKHRRKAQHAASLVRAGVDSPMETRLRLLVVLAGLPEPEVNIEFRDEFGNIVRRLDMGYRSAKLGLEYDGRQHAESAHQYASDVRRREDISALGWHEWTAVSKDIFQSPAETLDRIVAVMKQRGMTVPALRDDWRPHFPGW